MAVALYHAALPDDWELARALGAYTTSTRGHTLDEVGFVHCSFRNQVEQVANTFYADLPELILLQIDPEQLTVPVVDENLDGGEELFPHVYGPVPVHAVTRATEWRRDRGTGRYRLDAAGVEG